MGVKFWWVTTTPSRRSLTLHLVHVFWTSRSTLVWFSWHHSHDLPSKGFSSTPKRCRDEIQRTEGRTFDWAWTTASQSARMQNLVHKGCGPGCYHSLTIPKFRPKDGHPFYQSSLGAKWMEYVWNLHEFDISFGLIGLMTYSSQTCPSSFPFRQAWNHLHQGQGTTHA